MIDLAVKQKNYKRSGVCGDYVGIEEQGDILKVVLCDGLGHGIKANILATLTAQLVLSFDFKNGDLRQITNEILSIQPICSKRKINHSTYTLFIYDKINCIVDIVNYDNPKPMLFDNGKVKDIEWQEIMNPWYAPRPQKMQFASFELTSEMCVAIMSDGVTQSGVGADFSFGWGEKRVKGFISSLLECDKSASDIATSVISKSLEYESDMTHDDMSCIILK